MNSIADYWLDWAFKHYWSVVFGSVATSVAVMKVVS